MAQEGGASALLVFPPARSLSGQRPEMALAHFQRIADASDLPLIVFQYPLAGGQGYPLDTLLQLFDKVPTIRAIKDWTRKCRCTSATSACCKASQPVNVLSTNSSWLFSLAGAWRQGLLSGSAA